MTNRASDAICRLNDELRTTFTGGSIIWTPCVSGLPEPHFSALMDAVRSYTAFAVTNDPYGEHDFGAIPYDGKTYLWKIDYYAPDMQHGSDDPSDPAKTRRVLTIMRADEY